ncbi:hypothetical protein GCM10011613_21460 [Cellvibrio zantedeschiae]|uniref:Alpha/beta hydrolase n=1 Tax=Cellvibrio zantedeschiae TaxID=1237077 RepID=A0ABQ3B706_9GAMM|nr:alpha/beta hydrolase [Cellvibrio zantedeschiae]GGY76674.1 hypothetical protein GCM10011613_21460 [Cellvibrio zantedeschiae]
MIQRYLILIANIVLLAACQTLPQQPFTAPQGASVINANFKHFALSQPGTSTRLHVYIEGDGVPFPSRFQIAKDPSPSNPMMLKLMELDTSKGLYLGRPCYFSRSLPALTDEQCDSKLWTSARYSEEVVSSMVLALRQYLREHPAQGVSLIGHSGGGTLAMLMAARMGEVDQIVTLAGNLDIDAWARLHHYTALKDSLNPVELPVNVLPRKQLHFGGDKDDNIPPEITQAMLARKGLQIKIIKNADHNCCWLANWGEILAQINQQTAP